VLQSEDFMEEIPEDETETNKVPGCTQGSQVWPEFTAKGDLRFADRSHADIN
jgi:sulfur transfer protein SufE